MTEQTPKSIEQEALDVLILERQWVEFEGDEVDEEGMRYAFIEAASALAQRVSGYSYVHNPQTGESALVGASGLSV